MLSRTWKFFLLTIAISWLIWPPSVLRSNGVGNLPPIPPIATLGPAIAALFRDGARALGQFRDIVGYGHYCDHRLELADIE